MILLPVRSLLSFMLAKRLHCEVYEGIEAGFSANWDLFFTYPLLCAAFCLRGRRH